MQADKRPQIEVEITFLPSDEGGRTNLSETMEGYRPHFVVEDPGRPQSEVSGDAWLGVQFLAAPSRWQFGVAQRTRVELLYFPSVDYRPLTSGREFTIREGARVVGRGRVIRATAA